MTITPADVLSRGLGRFFRGRMTLTLSGFSKYAAIREG
jgi:hypothetical protein